MDINGTYTTKYGSYSLRWVKFNFSMCIVCWLDHAKVKPGTGPYIFVSHSKALKI